MSTDPPLASVSSEPLTVTKLTYLNILRGVYILQRVKHPQHGFAVFVVRRRRKDSERDIRELSEKLRLNVRGHSYGLAHGSSNKVHLLLPLFKVL